MCSRAALRLTRMHWQPMHRSRHCCEWTCRQVFAVLSDTILRTCGMLHCIDMMSLAAHRCTLQRC
jgi:hypothetical protein